MQRVPETPAVELGWVDVGFGATVELGAWVLEGLCGLGVALLELELE